MTSREAREVTLRRLLRDARAEKAPELDWERIEGRLMREAKLRQPQASRSLRSFGWGALVAAAMLAVWLVGTQTEVSVTPPPPAAVEAAATDLLHRNGDSMAIGARVAAGEREVSVSHASRATWTLSPYGSALLVGKGERIITVHLEHGSVLSEVVPSSEPETYVVEAAGARIAVHGTVFRVALEKGRVIVQVREGRVAVGPVGGVPAFFLDAPAYGDFASDGRSGTLDGRPLGSTAARRAEPIKQSLPRVALVPPASSAAPAASVELPAEPSISDIEVGIARVVESATDCFSQHTTAADGVRVTVRTALSLKIEASGVASEIAFQPPLSPEAAQCAAARISQVSFAPSKQGTSVTRVLELKR